MSKTKKIIFAAAAVLVAASCALASIVMTVRVGFLARLNTTEDEFARIVQNGDNTKGWNLISNRHELYGVKFYDSLNAMLLALDKYEVDEIALPDVVAEYITQINPDYEIFCVSTMRAPMNLSFGFRKDSVALAERFNRVINEMREDWTLAELQGVYIYDYEIDRSKPVKFGKFDDAETIRVAVTGDLPPIDYVDASGNPSGFNSALLAEIGSRLKVNIELVNIEAGARNSALSSGRVDIVFWYETSKTVEWNLDAPEGVILSEPYFSWNRFDHIGKK